MAPIYPAPPKALFFIAGIRCGVYLKESPVFQYGVRGLLLSLPPVKFYGSLYFPLHQRAQGLFARMSDAPPLDSANDHVMQCTRRIKPSLIRHNLSLP